MTALKTLLTGSTTSIRDPCRALLIEELHPSHGSLYRAKGDTRLIGLVAGVPAFRMFT